MGRLSGSWDPPAWGGPWKGLLLAASVLGSCLQPAPAQTPLTIVLTPPSPAVGGGVSLAPQNPPQDFVSCIWYRSATTDPSSRILTYFPGTPPVQTNDSAHTGRETAGPDCALHIAGLRLNDTGSYTVDIQSPTSPGLTTTVHLPVSDSTSSLGSSSGRWPGWRCSGACSTFCSGVPGAGGCPEYSGPKQRPPVGGQAAPAHNQGVDDNKPTLDNEDIQDCTPAFTAGDQKPPPGPQPRPGERHRLLGNQKEMTVICLGLSGITAPPPPLPPPPPPRGASAAPPPMQDLLGGSSSPTYPLPPMQGHCPLGTMSVVPSPGEGLQDS
ncbi:unnamed protein product [Eretmochelys imbricata]